MSEKKRLVLIDASSILYRSFFALPPMSAPSGEPTQALFGFAKFLLKWRLNSPVDHCLIAFDGREGKKRRAELLPSYKAHRQKAPCELISQMDAAPELCSALCLPHLQLQSEEADDVIASACRWAEKGGAEISIHSQDKDLLQLVSPNVSMLATHKDQLLFDPQAVLNLYGVSPRQLGDWLALVGDASDNIPGVAGIGPKKATQLLQRFGTLEQLLSQAEQVPGKLGETLRASRAQARLSRQLVELFDDVNHTWNWPELFIGPYHLERCRSLFQSWNFQSLLKQLVQKDEKKGGAVTTTSGLFDSSPLPLQLQSVENRHEWEKMLLSLNNCDKEHACTFDIGASITPARASRPAIIGLAFDQSAWALSIDQLEQSGLYLGEICRELFDQKSARWATDRSKDWYHLRMQLHSGQSAQLPTHKGYFDICLGGYLLQLSQQALFGTHPSKKGVDAQTFDGDALATRLAHLLKWAKAIPEQLEKENLLALYEDIEGPLTPILALMEHRGILIDVGRLKEERTSVCKRLEELQNAIWTACSAQFNLNSPKQLASILFEHLGLMPNRKIASGYSTDAAALEGLKEQHPVIVLLLEYRMLEKLRSTYIDALPQSVEARTGRIHPKFMQTVTSTGRLSCQEPNLQNIPIRSEWGGRIRSAFIAPKGWRLLSADYSQIELRLMAHYSRDPAMIDAFCNECDIHALTAARLFDVPLQSVTKQQRAQAKTVNFAVIYGQQAFGLASQLGISRAQAELFIRSYFARYPGVARYIEEGKKALEKSQTVTTLYGRKRSLARPVSGVQKRLNQRLAINSPIQGTGADLMKIAMIEVQRQIDRSKMQAHMILQIHDELLFECPVEEIEELKRLCRPAMESIADLRVPLIINVAVGNNWAEC